MKEFDVNLEEAAAESEQDRRDHQRLAEHVELLLQHEDAMRVPVACRRLVDEKVDPVVIAKTLLIGNRDGGAMYKITARAMAPEEDERVTERMMQIAVRDMDADLAATLMISGAVWLAEQFRIDRGMLKELVLGAARRSRHPERTGYGVVDFVDSHGVGSRGDIVRAIELARLPQFAPLEYRPGTVKA